MCRLGACSIVAGSVPAKSGCAPHTVPFLQPCCTPSWRACSSPTNYLPTYHHGQAVHHPIGYRLPTSMYMPTYTHTLPLLLHTLPSTSPPLNIALPHRHMHHLPHYLPFACLPWEDDLSPTPAPTIYPTLPTFLPILHTKPHYPNFLPTFPHPHLPHPHPLPNLPFSLDPQPLTIATPFFPSFRTSKTKRRVRQDDGW